VDWNVFATNVADRRGVLTGGLDAINPVAFNYIQRAPLDYP